MHVPGPRRRSRLLAIYLTALAGCFSSQAVAQTTFDVIGPGEYNLPVDFEPFNVFVQYATVQDNDKVRDADGDKVDGPGTQTLVGLSKYVRFWSPEGNRSIGLAYEIIVPEIGVRDTDSGAYSGGLGDPLTGFAVWYKPSDGSTFGLQSFMQIPVGTSAVSDTNWKNLTSFLWNWRIGKLQIDGDAGVGGVLCLMTGHGAESARSADRSVPGDVSRVLSFSFTSPDHVFQLTRHRRWHRPIQ